MTDRPGAYAFLERPEHLQRGSLASHVADRLRQAIVSLQLRPGAMLDKAEICARLGVSRSPVAEAVARLQSEGLVDVLPQRGSVVSLVSLTAVREYIVIRTGLECETVRLLAAGRPEGLIAALDESLARQSAAEHEGDAEAFHAADLHFHEILVAATGFRRMKAVVDTARNNLDRARHLSDRVRMLTLVVEEHRAIRDALERGDGDAAVAAMRTHLTGMVNSVFEFARTNPTLFSDGELAIDSPGVSPPD
ncbi:GntR family transcriptional regulator [Pelagibacterium montanilacus]|uniref:GntR family transcriptional regulator n=1 Tax=Pelagibacterium montanilacus TaxID=2185280 RepID=UPI000F8D078A|nr:GntR family transcriptional regulator [Pelagibacterium montanilacus]